MQHHPGSWYLPWGVPLQKMMALPFQHPNGPAAAGPAIAPYAPTALTPNGAGGAVTCQVIPNQPQHHSPNSAAVAAAMQAQTAPHQYQHPALHPAAGQMPVGAYNCPNALAAAAAAHTSMLNGHQNQMHHAHLTAHNTQLQASPHAHLHPAAAGLFTPLSLRSFLAASASNPLAGLATHQTLSSCGPSLQQAGVRSAQQQLHQQVLAKDCQLAESQAQDSTQAQMHQLLLSNSANVLQQQQQQLQQQQQQQHQMQLNPLHQQQQQQQQQNLQQQQQQHPHQLPSAINLNVGVISMRNHNTANGLSSNALLQMPLKKVRRIRNL